MSTDRTVGAAGPAGPLGTALDKALSVQRPAVIAHVQRIRRRMPDAGADQIISQLEKHYLSAVSTLGAAAGGTSALPGVGTSAAVVLGAAEIGTFLEVTALFALAVAEVHDVDIADLDRRRTLVLAVVLGNSGSSIVEKAAGRTGAHWGRMLVVGMPVDRIRAINRVLGRNFVTKYGAKQGILVLGRALPFGIGAAIGAGGNAALGYASVRAARRAFGPAPVVEPAGSPSGGAPTVASAGPPPRDSAVAGSGRDGGSGPTDLSQVPVPQECHDWVTGADPSHFILDHSVEVNLGWWNDTQRWSELPGGPVSGLSESGEVVTSGRARISRGYLFGLAAGAGEGDPDVTLRLLWHALAWGTGTRPRNNDKRLAAVLADVPAAAEALARAAGLAATDPIEAYRTLYPRNRTLISHLGPAFFTKFLYFAGRGSPDHPCLILDSRVAASLVRAGWTSLGTAGSWPAATYERYVYLLARWREDVTGVAGHRPRVDMFERWLFDQSAGGADGA